MHRHDFAENLAVIAAEQLENSLLLVSGASAVDIENASPGRGRQGEVAFAHNYRGGFQTSQRRSAVRALADVPG